MANPMLGDKHRNCEKLSLYEIMDNFRGLSPESRKLVFEDFGLRSTIGRVVVEKQGTFLSEYLSFQRHYEETGEVDEAVRKDLVSCVGEFDLTSSYPMTKTIGMIDGLTAIQDYSVRKKFSKTHTSPEKEDLDQTKSKKTRLNRRTFIKAIAGAGTLGLCYWLDKTAQENEDQSVLDRIKFLDKQYDDLR